MKLLDLFCGGGGAAMGYHRAGFTEITGVVASHPNYPFEFMYRAARISSGTSSATSPPCQAKQTKTGHVELLPICAARMIVRG